MIIFIIIDTTIINSNCSDYDIDLVNGLSKNEGKLLMCLNGVWGAFCDNSLGSSEANVICQQLGYQIGIYKALSNNINLSKIIIIISGTVVYGDYHPSTNDTVLFESVYCTGRESSLEDCTLNYFSRDQSCGTYNIAGIKCNGILFMKYLVQ